MEEQQAYSEISNYCGYMRIGIFFDPQVQEWDLFPCAYPANEFRFTPPRGIELRNY